MPDDTKSSIWCQMPPNYCRSRYRIRSEVPDELCHMPRWMLPALRWFLCVKRQRCRCPEMSVRMWRARQTTPCDDADETLLEFKKSIEEIWRIFLMSISSNKNWISQKLSSLFMFILVFMLKLVVFVQLEIVVKLLHELHESNSLSLNV